MTVLKHFKFFTLLVCFLPTLSNAATYTVTDPADTTATNTLRWAIGEANSNTGYDTIDIQVASGLSVGSGLPVISDRVLVQGNGVTITASGNYTVFYLSSTSSDSTIRDIALINTASDGYGIQLSSDRNQIINCAIGTNYADVTSQGFARGIYISGDSNLIGGDSTSGQGNIIGENGYGVYVVGSANTICGNNIGLFINQSNTHSNDIAGIHLDTGGDETVIGLPTTGWGNVIAGNSNYGIGSFRVNHISIQNNIIGMNSTEGVHPNDIGIYLSQTLDSLIGGDGSASQGNLIGGNSSFGIHMRSNSIGNSVCGNVIGLTSNQLTIQDNGTGIYMTQSYENAIGLPTSGWGNVICGNQYYGVYASNISQNTFQGNTIGLNSANTEKPNGTGIFFSGACYTNLIGGDSASGQGNIISGNDNPGLYVSDSFGNSICGNIIGLSSDQVSIRPNDHAIYMANADGNYVGLPISGWGNVISGNSGYGIYATDSDSNQIQNNLFGTNSMGSSGLGNNRGIFAVTSHANIIGGRLNANHNERNVFADNDDNAIFLIESGDNTISGNLINTSPDGLSQLADSGENVTLKVYAGYGNLIGGDNSDPNNLRMNIITGDDIGIQFDGGSGGNTVVGNSIGILADGSTPGMNYLIGIDITDISAPYPHDNMIGLPNSEGNLIANCSTGIIVSGSGSINNGLFGNTITAFSTAGIMLASTGNGDKGAPAITAAVGSTVSGTTPDTGDYIEVFRAEPGAGNGGSLAYLGATTATGTTWTMSVASFGGDNLVALASDGANNTSAFSTNYANTGPTPTVSPTSSTTPTASPSATPTMTPTSSPTPTVTSTHPALGDTSPTSTPTLQSTNTPDIDFKNNKTLAYPNPGKNQVILQVDTIPEEGLRIEIYNLIGERITTLTSESTTSNIVWQSSDVAAGIYLAIVFVDGTQWDKKKIAIVK